MIRDLSKRPKVVRRLDGALTAWRYFHGPNFAHEIRARRRRKDWIYQYDSASVMREEGEALMLVLVRFVEWLQAPISTAPITFEVWDTIAGWDAAAFIGDRPIVDTFRGPSFSSKAVAFDYLLDRCFSEVGPMYAAVFDAALIECGGNLSQRAMRRRLEGRSDIARAMSKGRPGSPFYGDE